MGIVYEAEQESLGRHVALKLLPSHALLDPHRLRRFQREARAAARLHHTNIVPVYGVGANDGVHYYVMQFIHGQGLDEVLTELKRLRAARGPTTIPGPGASPGGDADRPGPVTASGVAQALLTGDFSRGAPPEPPEGPPSPEAGTPPPAASESSVHLPGQAPHSTLSESGQQYWQSVARIGVQVAEALDYAHAQGTLHRDIKPSNLLLDTQGTVWVTDFGLAKASGTEDLTHTGDILGTLRYMAPERFQGKSDARSDVYSLGLTLYELLTFRPAFDVADRSKLIHCVTHEEPLPPRRVNPEVPRDLETIVLKAIAKEPAHRYATAAALAEDLKRFLDLKPIRARRVGLPERFWRWCRRNPAVASLLALLVTVFLAGFATVTWKWREAEQLREDEHAARAEAEGARKLADARAEQIRRDLNALAEANRLFSAGQLDVEAGRWQQAEAAFNRALQLRPDLPNLWTARAELYRQLYLWDLAAADFARAGAIQEGTDTHAWYVHALLRLSAGNVSGYRRLCSRMAEVYRDTKDKGASCNVARICLEVPKPAVAPARLVQLAASAGPDSTEAWHHWCLGLAHYRAGQYELALRACDKCHKVMAAFPKPLSYPVMAMARHHLGKAEEARQALRQAEQELDRWITFLMKEKVGQVPTSWWDLLEGPRFIAEAKTLLEGSPSPEDPRWWIIRGRGLAALGRTKQAAAEFARALSARPRDPAIRLAHFRFLAGEKQWVRAEKELAAAARLKPKDSDIWLDAFRAYADLGQRARADAALDQAAKRNPNDREVWTKGMDAYASLSNWEAARATHARAVAQWPDDNALQLYLVSYHAGREDWEKAEAEYVRVAAQRPKDAALREAYALKLMTQKRDFHKAAAALTEATRLQPDDENGWNLLGVCYLRLEAFPKALDAFTNAIQLKPANPLFWSNRGFAHAELGKWKSAAQDFARAVDLQPSNVNDRGLHALCCLSAGLTEDYRRGCATLLQMAEQAEVVSFITAAVQSYVLTPVALPEGTRLLKLLKKSESSNEKSAAYFRLLGRVNYRAGKFGEARRNLEQSNRLFGTTNAPNEFFLALSNHQLGQAENARRSFKKAVHAFREATAKNPGQGPGVQFHMRQPLELLRREAEAVLNAPHRREAEEHFRNREWAKAIAHYDKLIEADSKFWPDLASRGYCHAELGDLKKAHADFARAVGLGQAGLGDTWLYHWHCVVCLTVGDADGLRRSRDRLTKRYKDSKDPNELLRLTCLYQYPEDEVDRARVVRWTEKVVTIAPAFPDGQLMLVSALYRAGRYEDALRRSRKVLDVGIPEGGTAELDFYLAMIHHRLGHAEKARRHFLQAVEWVERFADLGQVPPAMTKLPTWVDRLEWKVFRREAEALLKPPPPSPVGKCMRERKWAEAVRHLDRRLAADPRSELDLASRALCHVELRHWDKAAADYAALAQLQPDNVSHPNCQSAALLAAGKRVEARRVCTRMLERFGTREDFTTLMGLAAACVRTPDVVSDREALLVVARRLSRIDPIGPRYIGAALYRAGRWGEAVQRFEESARTFTPRAWDWLFLAMAHQRLGHTTKARECFAQAQRWVAEAEKLPAGAEAGWGWWGQRVAVEQLTREAKALLKR
jgi:tetratricopeptide (TPR) repeat protein